MKYLLLLISLTACDFGDTNIDPIRLVEASVEELLPAAISQSIRNINSIGGRVTGIVVQHYEGVDAQPQGYAQYLINERTLDVFWGNGLYAGAMKDCRQIIEQANAAGQNRYAGIAKILMAHNLGIATSFWGNVPFSEAFQAITITQPVYDDQEALYEQLQSLLSEAIVDLQVATDTSELTGDLIFGGDTHLWIATAYAMRARYYLHLSKRRPDAAAAALEMLEMGAFDQLAEQPDFKYKDNHNESNPFSLFHEERPRQMILGTYLLTLLQTNNDPRLLKMATENNGKYELYQTNNEILYWSQKDTPIPLISLTECQFIEAEVLLRLGRNAEAETIFKKAVRSHFLQMNMAVAEREEFVNTTIHFTDNSDLEDRIEKLISQKYIALFVQASHEAWNDYRRTAYPRLTVPSDANSSFNPSLIIPRRYLYPLSERNTNLLHYQKAIDQQGGHFMDIDVWVFED